MEELRWIVFLVVDFFYTLSRVVYLLSLGLSMAIDEASWTAS